jgi:hypothetical protein
VGEEVQRKEGGRRAKYRHPAGDTGVTIQFQEPLLSTLLP